MFRNTMRDISLESQDISLCTPIEEGEERGEGLGLGSPEIGVPSSAYSRKRLRGNGNGINGYDHYGDRDNTQNPPSLFSLVSQESSLLSQEIVKRVGQMNCGIGSGIGGTLSSQSQQSQGSIGGHYDQNTHPSPPQQEKEYILHYIINHFLPGTIQKINPVHIWVSPSCEKSRYRWDFREEGELGRGGHSAVYSARHRLDGTLYAIKRSYERIDEMKPSFNSLREVCAHVALKGCPNLVHYYSSWIEDDHLWIQLELCLRVNLDIFTASSLPFPSPPELSKLPPSVLLLSEGENSFSSIAEEPVLKESNSTESFFSEESFWRVLSSISTALEFMHSRCLAHMDIRPANMFIAPSLSTPSVISPPHLNPNPNSTQSQSQNQNQSEYPQNSQQSGCVTPRYSQSTSTGTGSLFPPSMSTAPMAIATTGTGTTLRRHSSFPPLPHPTAFPPPPPSLSRGADGEQGGGGQGQGSVMEIQSNLDDSFTNFTQQSDIGYEYSQNSIGFGNLGSGGGGYSGQYLSCPGTPLEELPPIEMSQSEEIFEQYRNKTSLTIQPHEINQNLSNGNWIVKLGDLGLCCRFDDYSLLNDGEQRYLPNEILQDLRPLDFTKADIFSLGASLYELCRGKVLEVNGDEWRLLRDGRFQTQLDSYEQTHSTHSTTNTHPTHSTNSILYDQLMRYSPDVREILKQMLHPDPTQRPTATALKILSTTHTTSHSHSLAESSSDLMISRLKERIVQLERENELLRMTK